LLHQAQIVLNRSTGNESHFPAACIPLGIYRLQPCHALSGSLFRSVHSPICADVRSQNQACGFVDFPLLQDTGESQISFATPSAIKFTQDLPYLQYWTVRAFHMTDTSCNHGLGLLHAIYAHIGVTLGRTWMLHGSKPSRKVTSFLPIFRSAHWSRPGNPSTTLSESHRHSNRQASLICRSPMVRPAQCRGISASEHGRSPTPWLRSTWRHGHGTKHPDDLPLMMRAVAVHYQGSRCGRSIAQRLN
jgi:hypothetical protein